MDQRLREALMLLKEYCSTFNLKPTANPDDFKGWEKHCGPIIAGAYHRVDGFADMPPVIYVTPAGDIIVEQDEELLGPTDPVTDIIEHSVIRVSINNKRPLHDAMTTCRV